MKKTVIMKKSYSVTFQNDVMIFVYSAAGKIICGKEMTYKKFFALDLPEFHFKMDRTANNKKRIAKLIREGYTITNADDYNYKFNAVKTA